jgi:hypothetical protein
MPQIQTEIDHLNGPGIADQIDGLIQPCNAPETGLCRPLLAQEEFRKRLWGKFQSSTLCFGNLFKGK